MMWTQWLLVVLLVGASAASAGAQQRPAASKAATTLYGDSWAVIIGINDYQHPRVPKLRYAVNDAKSVGEAILAHGFRRERIITLTDREATKARIEGAIGDRLRQRVGREDRVFVFFAGHGMTVTLRSGEEEGYLIPVDGDPSMLFSTGVSMSSLRQISDLLPAKHILYVVDACYSGYAVFNRAITDELIDEMVKKPAIQILTAGRQGDLAQEKAGHGVFTDVLLRGLRGEAFVGRGWLALDQLGSWVRERVYAESNKKQVPQFGNLSGDGQFVFVRPGTPLAVALAPAPPPRLEIREEVRPPFGSLALNSKVDGVEVWLGDQHLGEVRTGRAVVVNNVPEGTHRLRGTKVGHGDWVREVRITSNQRSEIVIDIEPSQRQEAVLSKEYQQGAALRDVLFGEKQDTLSAGVRRSLDETAVG